VPAPNLSKPPRLLRFVEATPPAALAERGATDVILNIDIDDKGQVVAVDVVKSGGPEFDAAAVAAARQFEFEPGEANGKPVPVRITYSYHFVLKSPPEPPPAPPAAGPEAATAPQGPTAPISGRVLRKGDRVPIAGVAVLADEGAARSVTDEEGRFAFDALPVGAHTLKLRGATITPVDTTVTTNPGKQLELTFYADSKERYASTVRGQRPVMETVETTLRVEEIQRIPGTQGDTLKAVQNLPGVARAPFGIGLLSVWGSSPADTRVYIDGVNIPTLYHFGGLRSTFNSEMVSSLSFVPGGYQVDHGLGLGGVIDVASRTPRSDGLHGYTQIDLVDGSLMLEGPLTKTLSFAVAGRRSWIDATLPYFTTSTLQLTPVYYDYQARLSWKPNQRNDVDLLFFGSDDQLDVAVSRNGPRSTTAASHNYFHRSMLRWLRRMPGGATLSLTSSVGYDVPLQVGVQFGNVPTSIDARTLGYSLRALADVPIRDWLRLFGGLDYEGNRFTQDRAGVARPPIGGASGDSAGGFGEEPASFNGFQSGYAADSMMLYTNHVAPFLSAKLALFGERLTITPQFRLQVMSFAGYPGTDQSFTHTYVSPNPRLALRYRLTSRVALKGAVGAYSQPPAPEAFSRVFGNPNLKPQQAMHYVLGVDVDVTSTLRVEVDGFWKDMRDLVVRGEEPDGPALVNDGEGRAYGVQMLARQQLAKNFFGWISYTFSRAERKDHPDEDWHRYQFDQTHILTLMGSYRLPRGFQVGVRYRYVTGNPFTPVVDAYFDSNADRYQPITAAPFSQRLPAFNQLDIRIDKLWTFDKWRFSIYLDVQNVTRATNPEAISYNYNFTVPQPISGLPLLPILGVRGDF
jgi:TonB family protein